MSKVKVKLVQKRAKLSSLEDIVKLQLMLYCFTNHIHLSAGDYVLLTHIAIYGYDRTRTPNELVEQRKFLHKQSVRNTRNKLLSKRLLVEPQKRRYTINPEMEIESEGVVMIEFKAINA
jgi:urease accessory protein UreH